MRKSDSKTDPAEDLRTDLESAHVLFPVQAKCTKPLPASRAVVTKLREGGWGPGQCTHDVDAKCTASPFVFLALS